PALAADRDGRAARSVLGAQDRGGLEAPLLAPVPHQHAATRAPGEPGVELGSHRYRGAAYEAVLPSHPGAQQQRLAAWRELEHLAELHPERASDDRDRLIHQRPDLPPPQP